eukprot:COSAG01_NODE_66283_length_270_cov_1.497076_1_plen_89_part_11
MDGFGAPWCAIAWLLTAALLLAQLLSSARHPLPPLHAGPSKGTPHIPKLDISKIKSHLDKMKGAEGMAKPEAASMRLPKFEPGKINVEE